MAKYYIHIIRLPVYLYLYRSVLAIRSMKNVMKILNIFLCSAPPYQIIFPTRSQLYQLYKNEVNSAIADTT